MKYYELLQQHPIFKEFKTDDINKMIHFFKFSHQLYSANTFVYLEGDPLSSIGILLSGRIYLEKYKEDGTKYVLSSIEPMSIFGDFSSSKEVHTTTCHYRATRDCIVYYIPFELLKKSIDQQNPYIERMLFNIISLEVQNNRNSLSRLEILSQKTIQQKMITFLSLINQNRHFLTVTTRPSTKDPNVLYHILPLNHSELADYLDVNRSSLERELMHMKKEGLLSFDKKTFSLLI